VCDPDEALELLMRMRPGARPAATASRRRGGRADAPRADEEGSEQPPAEPVDERQFEQLRKWRWERAQGKPAFTVAANAVLDDVLRRRPRSIEELLEIRGIGPAFCEKHGESLLAALEYAAHS
jgi:superfamily II DNA helicase RecQ